MEKSLKSVIDRSPPVPKKVTKKTREKTMIEADRFRGSVRISSGKFYTDEEFEDRKRRVFNTPLP